MVRSDGLTRIMVMVMKVEANDDGVHSAEVCRQFSFRQPSKTRGKENASAEVTFLFLDYVIGFINIYLMQDIGHVDWSMSIGK